MRLYTQHDPSFDLVKEVSDAYKGVHLAGSYDDDNRFREAYEWLFGHLKMKNIIWCHDKDDVIYWCHGQEFKQWVLEVPDDEIIACLDTNVWNHIINRWWPIPNDLWESWHDYATKNIENTEEVDKYIDKKEEEYKSNHSEDEDKLNIFLPIQTSDEDYHEFIVTSPIKPEWVVEVRDISAYNPEWMLMGTGIKRKFDTEEEAKKWQECMESLLYGSKINFEVECGEEFGEVFVKYSYEEQEDG